MYTEEQVIECMTFYQISREEAISILLEDFYKTEN